MSDPIKRAVSKKPWAMNKNVLLMAQDYKHIFHKIPNINWIKNVEHSFSIHPKNVMNEFHPN